MAALVRLSECAVVFTPQTDRRHPFVDHPGILPGADVRGRVGAAGEGVRFDGPAAALEILA
jgi:hypothetical protein